MFRSIEVVTATTTTPTTPTTPTTTPTTPTTPTTTTTTQIYICLQLHYEHAKIMPASQKCKKRWGEAGQSETFQAQFNEATLKGQTVRQQV